MLQLIQFGEKVEGFPIRVLNEREIRAAAGILFLATFISLNIILATGNFVPVKYVVTVFLVDFIIRVFVNPRLAPTLIIGRWIVHRQTPEYIGAPQKKFAWSIGVALSSVMFVFLVLVNAYSLITGLTCLVCLVFLFFESAFGICLGCLFYPLFFKGRAQYCPGEICDARSKQDIQKTSGAQWLVVAGLVVFVIALASFFNGQFRKPPHYLFGNYASARTK